MTEEAGFVPEFAEPAPEPDVQPEPEAAPEPEPEAETLAGDAPPAPAGPPLPREEPPGPPDPDWLIDIRNNAPAHVVAAFEDINQRLRDLER